MSFVWDGFPASGSEMLVMLALADWCNDEGGSLHPSMRAVAGRFRLSDSISSWSGWVHLALRFRLNIVFMAMVLTQGATRLAFRN